MNSGEIFRMNEPMAEDKRQRMEQARDQGHLVEVSEQVAEMMELGRLAKAEKEKRRAKNKRARQARKRNR